MSPEVECEGIASPSTFDLQAIKRESLKEIFESRSNSDAVTLQRVLSCSLQNGIDVGEKESLR